MIPKISSIIAAPKIALPEAVFNLPISCNVSTVILTDVAVRITPTKTACINNDDAFAGSIQPASKNQ